jgi:hypothetical protein
MFPEHFPTTPKNVSALGHHFSGWIFKGTLSLRVVKALREN